MRICSKRFITGRICLKRTQARNMVLAAHYRTHDIDGFATALTDMCRDGAHREALIAAGVANLARFEWTRTVDALVALYSDAVNTDTGGRRP